MNNIDLMDCSERYDLLKMVCTSITSLITYFVLKDLLTPHTVTSTDYVQSGLTSNDLF